MRARVLGSLVAVALLLGPPAAAGITDPGSTLDGMRGATGDRSITFVGTVRDRSDLWHARLGHDGHWFAHFDAPSPTTGAPTSANARDALPAWVAAPNHTEHPADPGCTEPGALQRGCLPTYAFRTFSQDGPARSAGGFSDWATLRLPDGSCGTAGAIVDPHTYVGEQEVPDPTGVLFPPSEDPRPNNNNTVNRIQLQDGTPETFFVGVVTDTTGGAHDPARLEIRGNVGLVDHREEVADSQVEPDGAPGPAELAANGIPDVHVFRIDGFASGDYLKLRLQGRTAPASFAGLLFDEHLRVPTPAHARASGRRVPSSCR